MEKYAVVAKSMDSDFIWCNYQPNDYCKEDAEAIARKLNEECRTENNLKRKVYIAVPYSEVDDFWDVWCDEYPCEHYQIFIETEDGDLIEFNKSFLSAKQAFAWCHVHSDEDGVKYVYRLTNEKI